MGFRIERDTLGEVKVPLDKYWGAQTQRSIENFQIGPPGSMPLEIVQAYGYLKKAAAFANLDFSLLSKEKCDLIVRVSDEIIAGKLNKHFPLVIWQTGSGTQTNMNVNEVIANRAELLLGDTIRSSKKFLHPNDDVNRSQSSNDTFPTAMSMAAYTTVFIKTIPAIEALAAAFTQKSSDFRDVVKIGRTHMMDAIPITLGQEFSSYAAQINHGLAALKNSLKHLKELAIGGTAVGTGLNSPAGFGEKTSQYIAKFTGLPFQAAENTFAAIAAHDSIVETHGALKLLAVSLTKIANDIRLLSSGPRSGIGEIVLPAKEPGSSIMPGKVNPTQVEALTMVCAQVMGNDVTISLAGASGQLELNVYKPVIIYNFLQSANLLADACASFSLNCIHGLEPNQPRIDRHLNRSLMLVTALVPQIGYEKAAHIAKTAHKNGTTLKEEAMSLGYLTEQQFDELINPKNMV